MEHIKIENELLAAIEGLLTTSGMSPSAFGSAACEDPKIVMRLRSGREIRSGTINAIREYIKNYEKKNN